MQENIKSFESVATLKDCDEVASVDVVSGQIYMTISYGDDLPGWWLSTKDAQKLALMLKAAFDSAKQGSK